MRSAWVFAAGVVLGILLIIGGVQLARAFGGGMTGPMSPMLAQMMGSQGMADMMAQMMHNPKFMESMASACAQPMKDPAARRSMQEAMQSPGMAEVRQVVVEVMSRHREG